MKTIIKTYLPVFPGFYNTIFESDESNEIEHFRDETGMDIDFDDINFDYQDYFNRVSQRCCEIVENELNSLNIECDIKFENVVSPKYYNFSNDSINIEIEIDLQDVSKYLLNHLDLFKDYLRENYTSCSGFISHYSNEAHEWINDLRHEHKLGSALNFILSTEGVDQWSLFDRMDGEDYLTGELIEND